MENEININSRGEKEGGVVGGRRGEKEGREGRTRKVDGMSRS